MRPSSRQRVAAWLLALPSGSGGGEECARRGRLEMISFWLLCWKLLRATTGLRRITPELTDGNHGNSSSGNSHPADDPSTPTQPPDPVAMEISSSPPLTDLERDNLFSCQEVEGLHYPEFPGLEDTAKEEAQNGKVGGDECDYLVFEIGRDRGEGAKKKEEEEEEKKEDGWREETEGEDEGRGEVEGQEGRGETEGEVEERRREIKIDRGKVEGEDESEEETGGKEEWGRREIEGEDEGRDKIEGEDGGMTELRFLSGSPLCPVAAEQPAPEAWGHDPGNADDLSDGHLSDCLQAELAAVYSDSDAGEDPWAAFTSAEVTKPAVETSDGKGEREEERKEEEEERKEEEERGGGAVRHDEEENEEETSRAELSLRSPSACSTTSSMDHDRRVPPDFCVHQEMRSSNVSTEHVDFLIARQQWKKMEAEVKGRPIPKPGLSAQGSFQGTHSSLYPPTRSPRLKHREINPPGPREAPLSSTLSPSSEDSGLDDPSYRSPLEEPESAVEREIRLTLEREERHRRERGMISQGLTIPRPSTLQTGRSPPRPPACRTPTLSVSPTPPCSSSLPRPHYHEMTANNVIILEPDSSCCSSSSSSVGSRNRIISSTVGGLSEWQASLEASPTSTNVIVVETSNLIIRSASEFCLSTPAPAAAAERQESTFTSNPFFKLRSLSSQSLVEQEIKLVRHREEEWRRQREDMWRKRREEEWRRGKERYDTVLVSPGLSDSISFNVPDVADRCVSSPSSPSRTRKMQRASLSCDNKFPTSLSSVPQRQNAMAQRWEASLLANQKKE